MRVIGLMSGTSYDAVDAAAADLHLVGDTLELAPLGMLSEPYPDTLRAALAAALPPAGTTMEDVCRLDTRIGQSFASLAVRADRELCEGRAELIVSHGQTVYHWTDDGRVHGTLQIGCPAWIAEATGRPVVSDLRTRDVAAGGQGAPLVSIFDSLWLRGRQGAPVALNLGGIANITVLPEGAEPLAFDTGPANALIDAAVHHLTNGRLDYDTDGALAARGVVSERLLDRLLDEPYYARPAPKTTGKELFHLPYLLAALAECGPLPAEDVTATVTLLTARTVADAARSVGATEVIASGGGTKEPDPDGHAPRGTRRRPAPHLRRPRPACCRQGGVRVRRPRLSHRTRPARHRPLVHRRATPRRPGLDHARCGRAAPSHACEVGPGAPGGDLFGDCGVMLGCRPS